MTTHRRVLEQFLGRMWRLVIRALNRYRPGGGREEEDQLWAMRRWAEKGVRRRYEDKQDGIKRR